MKLQVVQKNRHPLMSLLLDLGRDPDEIIGMAPFCGKILIATRSKLLMVEQDEETGIMIKEIVTRHRDELWPDI